MADNDDVLILKRNKSSGKNFTLAVAYKRIKTCYLREAPNAIFAEAAGENNVL